MNFVPHTFQNELAGCFGDWWKHHAEELIEREKDAISRGEITIDENGVARNSIGRVLMSDRAEVVSYATNKINLEATEAARNEEVQKELEDLRKNPPKMSAEDFEEMRAALGSGQKVVNILTGQIYRT